MENIVSVYSVANNRVESPTNTSSINRQLLPLVKGSIEKVAIDTSSREKGAKTSCFKS